MDTCHPRALRALLEEPSREMMVPSSPSQRWAGGAGTIGAAGDKHGS